jgi:hypothetical protein
MTSQEGDLEPIRLILEDGADHAGWIYTQGQRMTDILSAGEPFSFLSEDDMTQWTEVLPADTVLVVPPPHTSDDALRLPAHKHAVQISAGDLRVTGTAHLRPGEQDDPMLRATRRFLPLTDATFSRGDGPEERVDVVIVNLRRTSEFRIV